MQPFRAPGTTATLRGAAEKVFWAYPITVVEDCSSLVAMYLAAGTAGKNAAVRPAPRDLLHPDTIRVVDHVWARTDVLLLVVPGEVFSVNLMWESDTHELMCWYLNLQEPIRRTAIGFDTMDHMLDIVVSPDMSNWRWKDEDEFEEAERIGYYSHAQARGIRAQGEKALRLLTFERRDFYERWKDWTAGPGWCLSELSPAWDRLDVKAPVVATAD